MSRFDQCFCAFVLLLCACHEDSSTLGSGPIRPADPLDPPRKTNLGLAVKRFAGDERVLVVGVPESGQGGLDRNADGDTLDEVALAIDLESGSRHDLAVAL